MSNKTTAVAPCALVQSEYGDYTIPIKVDYVEGVGND